MISAGTNTIVPDDIDCHINLEIGSYTSIASGLTIVSGQHPPIAHPKCVSNFPFREWGISTNYPYCSSERLVEIGSDVWIGQNVTIMEGAYIAPGAIVAANSLVLDYVYPYEVVAGVPAKRKKRRFENRYIQQLLEIQWWLWPADKIKTASDYMYDIDIFLDWVNENN